MPSVLVVEDERSIRFLIVSILEQQQYSVTEAENGLKALEALDLNPDMDLVISDIQMPAMDGVELTQKLVQRYPGIPILIVSAFPIEGQVAVDEGASDFLRKPFTYATLVAAVGKLLN